nr:phospholipase A2 inhibitor subunit gamma B-like [Zootoca vivipara]
MPAVLGLLFFSVLLTPGDLLECEKCTAEGTSCKGSVKRCSPDDDTCVVFLTEFKIGDSLECETCTEVGLNCTGKMENCSAAEYSCVVAVAEIVAVPPISSKANGKKCPACFTQYSQCSTEEAECTGDEDHCLDATIKSGAVEITVKGCTTKSYCAAVQEMIRTTFNVTASETLNAKCEPANKAPLASRFPLLALLGLLAGKILLY